MSDDNNKRKDTNIGDNSLGGRGGGTWCTLEGKVSVTGSRGEVWAAQPVGLPCGGLCMTYLLTNPYRPSISSCHHVSYHPDREYSLRLVSDDNIKRELGFRPESDTQPEKP